MKNWKKVMAMLCAAAMVTGFSAPVWAEADAAENQQESVQTADKTHSVWYLFGAAVSAMFAGLAGSKRKKKSDEEL